MQKNLPSIVKAKEVEAVKQAPIPTQPATASGATDQPTETSAAQSQLSPKYCAICTSTRKLCRTEHPITYKADWSDNSEEEKEIQKQNKVKDNFSDIGDWDSDLEKTKQQGQSGPSTKPRIDIYIWNSYSLALQTLYRQIWQSDHCVLRGWTERRNFWRFFRRHQWRSMCRALRAELIHLSALVCPYLRSARNFIPYNYKYVFALLINHNQHLPTIWTMFLLNLAAWVAIKPMDPAKRTRVPGDKDCCPLSELMRG